MGKAPRQWKLQRMERLVAILKSSPRRNKRRYNRISSSRVYLNLVIIVCGHRHDKPDATPRRRGPLEND
jgi:hypothetical protein